MDIISQIYAFSRYKVNIRVGSKVQALQYRYPGAPKEQVSHPLYIEAHGKYTFFGKRETYGLHTVFRNPMMLMMGVTMLLAFLGPKMMKNMDPKEMEEMQAKMGGGSNDPADLWKELMGGGKKKGDDSDSDED